MANTIHFFIKTNAEIGQTSLELARAFNQDACVATADGTVFPVVFDDLSEFRVEAHLNLTYTDLRETGDAGIHKGTALEYFDYEVEVEFSRKTIREHREEIDRIGRLLYDQLVRESSFRRPMAYVLDDLAIAAATFPDGRTRTLTPAIPSDDPRLRAELTHPDILEYREDPGMMPYTNPGICVIRHDGESLRIQPLLHDGYRDPVSPGAIVTPETAGPAIVGDAFAFSMRHSAAATSGEIEYYAAHTGDLLELADAARLLAARAHQGRLILAPMTRSPEAREAGVGDPIYDGPPPSDRADLGALIEYTLAR